MANLSSTNQADSHEMMAEIFNSLDRGTENRFMTLLWERNCDSANKIKSLMFTFEDLAQLDSGCVQTLRRGQRQTWHRIERLVHRLMDGFSCHILVVAIQVNIT